MAYFSFTEFQTAVYLNGCWGTGQGDECACSLILDGRTGRLQQVVDATDEAGAL
jgi:hypothetical protein